MGSILHAWKLQDHDLMTDDHWFLFFKDPGAFLAIEAVALGVAVRNLEFGVWFSMHVLLDEFMNNVTHCVLLAPW